MTKKELKEKLTDACCELMAVRLEERGSWRGCSVYVPVYKGCPKIGLPYVVLVTDADVRISTEEESLSYLDYVNAQ